VAKTTRELYQTFFKVVNPGDKFYLFQDGSFEMVKLAYEVMGCDEPCYGNCVEVGTGKVNFMKASDDVWCVK
jgi:hypothetical protein